MARHLSKAKTATLKSARQRIESAKGFRRHEGYDDLWRRMIDLYRGKHFPKDTTAEDLFVVNVSKATVDVILPSVSVNNPKLTVSAVSAEEAEQAIIAEAVINYYWRHYGVLPEFKAALKDFLICGFGFVKCGYKFVEEEQEDTEAFEAEVSNRMGEIDEFAGANPNLASGLPTELEVREETPTITNNVVLESAPFVERCSPFDIFVDPEAKTMADARWIAQRVYKTLDAVQEDKQYSKAGRDSVQADSRTPDSWSGSGFDSTNKGGFDNIADDAKRVTVWEFYDLVENEMMVFSDGGDHFLVEPTDLPYESGHPFVMLRNYDIPDLFYPMGELESIEALQNELNMTRTQMFADRKQFSRRYIARRDSFDERARNDLTSNEDNVVVFVNGNEPLDQIIAPMPSQQVNPELFQDSQVIEADLREVSGVSEYQRGASPEIRRTATEASMMADAADARAQDKLASVEAYIGEIGEKLLALAQQFITETQQARITQRDGLPFHFEFEPEDIQGQFDMTVVGGSTRPMNDTVRREQATELINTLAPFGDPQIGLVNMSAVLDHVLQAYGVTDTSKFLNAGSQVTQGMGMPPPPAGEEAMMGPPPEGAPPMGAPGMMPMPAEEPGMVPENGGDPMAVDPLSQIPPELIEMIASGQPLPPELEAMIPPEMMEQILMALQGGGGPPPPEALPMGAPAPAMI